MHTDISKKLWQSTTKLWLLMIAAAILLCMLLPTNILWTVESRWAAVTLQMLLQHDYLHPYHYCSPYYDKPLFSYWLILVFAKILGNLNQLALRLPSALAGLTTIWTVYAIGNKLFSRPTGLIAGWLLTTTFYFIFWSRTASADMLNVAGCMLAVWWYLTHKNHPTWRNYFIFFLITAITSLFKGLLGLIIPGLIILPDLLVKQEWKKHLRAAPFIAFVLAAIIYLLPFLASAYYFDAHASNNGLVEVFRENIVRFFQPFDHKAPIYIYFFFLPIYTLPWFLLFIPTLIYSIRHWKTLSLNQRWLFKALGVLFLFLTLSGSRRSYYVLPLVPLVILSTADWLNTHYGSKEKMTRRLANLIISCYLILLLWFGITQPIINHYKAQEIGAFVNQVQTLAARQKPWSQWQLAVFNNNDHKIVYYLKPQHAVQCYKPGGTYPQTIIITERKELPKIVNILSSYQPVSSGNEPDDIIAFIPNF